MIEKTKCLITFLALLLPLAGCTSVMDITSTPSGATFYGGKTQAQMKKSDVTTPVHRTAFISKWESWCYKVTKEGYYDSKTLCLPPERDRIIHFDLKKIPGQKPAPTAAEKPTPAAPAPPQTAAAPIPPPTPAPPPAGTSPDLSEAPPAPTAYNENTCTKKNIANLIKATKSGSLAAREDAIGRLLTCRPYPPQAAAAISNYAITQFEAKQFELARKLISGDAGKYATRILILALDSRNPENRALAAV